MIYKILIVTLSILAFLVFHRYIRETKEHFISNLKRRKEHFENISIQNVHVDSGNNRLNNDNELSNEEQDTDDGELDSNELNNSESNNDNLQNNSNQGTCDGKKPEGECLFGCDDKGAGEYVKEEEIKTKTANLDEMMKTFEDTEKMCEAIEKKDKERRDREAIENLDKQLQLNKKFLIQQRAQNKQIEDLQKLIKAMHFDEDMRKVSIEKCSGKADDCLSNKEKKMNQILKMREARKQNMKINLNIDPFGDEFKKKLMESLKMPESEINKILMALKEGKITMDDLINGNNMASGIAANKGIDGNGTKDEVGYDKSCPNCKVDLNDYIDRCKIPCKDCRDPSWKCPQDVGGKK